MQWDDDENWIAFLSCMCVWARNMKHIYSPDLFGLFTSDDLTQGLQTSCRICFFCVTCVASSGWVESNDFASCAPQNSSRRLKRFALLTTAQRGCLKCPKRGAEHGMADDWSQHGCHDMGKLYWLSAQDNLSVTCLTSRFKLKIHISCLHSIQTILELFKHQANIKCKTKTPEILWCHPFPLQIHKHLASPKLTRLLYHHGVTACSKAAAVSQLQTPSPMGRALLSCPIQNCPARKKSWNRALWWFDEGRAMT